MAVDKALSDTYRALRSGFVWINHVGQSNRLPACVVLAEARARVAAGNPMRYHGRRSFPPGAPYKIGRDEVRHHSDYRASGFRLVGESAKLAPRAVEGNWYSDTFKDSTYNGAVFLAPGRNGHAQVYTGYIESANSDGSAIICTHRFDAIDSRGDDPERYDYHDAACDASHIAQIAAKRSREYDQAWQAGSSYNNNREEMSELRAEMRKLAHASRDNVRQNPVICGALRSLIAEARAASRKLHDRNEKLAAGEYYSHGEDLSFSTSDSDLREAFCDGAQLQEFPA